MHRVAIPTYPKFVRVYVLHLCFPWHACDVDLASISIHVLCAAQTSTAV